MTAALSRRENPVAESLRCGKAVTDTEFDQVFEPWVQEHSDTHWTPVEAVLRAIEWLELTPDSRVLDVGSGCGKFCLVGALGSPATFVGVERRVELVRAAEAVANALAIERVTFIHADFSLVSWTDFDAFYFSNPFAEYLYGTGSTSVIDDKMSGQTWRYDHAIEVAEQRLAALPIGTRVVCYNGYGGEMPANFHVKRWQRINDCYLRLWVKEATPRASLQSTAGPALTSR